MSEKIQSHKDLIVWQKSVELVLDVYRLTRQLPHDELYGLVSQMRRSAVAISSNIAEGYQRNHRKEYIQFLYIAKGSASELETQLIIAKRLEFIVAADYQRIDNLLTEILKMLSAMILRLQNKMDSKR
ncbi:MAG TPA: four helix bundle protein [Candidatus Omnitrophota bacterium]|nr:four helix bundle protein [Candidatus Omnitrophota bacterium]HPD85628.1 four helix bundle protein [Candidatus Omnitrophota bacterium]HRZ04471.1 four helix bundle protein [Candidatus Omnitrophota bacterium]